MPTEAQMHQAWIEIIRSNQGICGNAIRLCELHFMRSEVRKTGLVRGAVPSIFNFEDREAIMTQPFVNDDISSKTDSFGITAVDLVDDKTSIIMHNP